MAYDVSVVNIDLIRQYKSNFTSEKNQFTNRTYGTFLNGYINNCSDPYVVKMKNTLNTLYGNVNNAYSSIKSWWDDYVNNYTGLSSSLAYGDNKITEPSLKNFIGNSFSTYDSELGNVKITPTTNSSINSNSTSEEFDITDKRKILEAAHAMNQDREVPQIEATFFEKAASTFVMTVESVGHGLLKFGANVDCAGVWLIGKFATFGASMTDAVVNFGEFITGDENAMTWETTNKDAVSAYFTSKAAEIASAPDELSNMFYEDTKIGRSIETYSAYDREDIWYSSFQGLGQTAGTIGLAALTGGTSLGAAGASGAATTAASTATTASAVAQIGASNLGIAGLVNGTGESFGQASIFGASFDEADTAAKLGGLWGYASWYGGARLGGATFTTNPFVNSTIRIGSDAAFGGSEAIVQSFIQSTYATDEYGNKKTFSQVFKDNGGWKSVAKGATLGATMSGVGEIGNIINATELSHLYDTNPNELAHMFDTYGLSDDAIVDLFNNKTKNELITAFDNLQHGKINVSDLGEIDLNKLYDTNPNELAKMFEKQGYSSSKIEEMFNAMTKDDLIDLLKEFSEVDNVPYNVFNKNDRYYIPDDNLPSQIKEIVDEWNENYIDMDIGNKLEDIFYTDTDDYIYGVHRTADPSAAANIYENGLRLSGDLSSGVLVDGKLTLDDLENNISFFENNDWNYAKFMEAIESSSGYKNYYGNGKGYGMIIKIPKNIDNIDLIIEYKDGIPVLKPEYVIGKVEVDNGNIFSSVNTKFKDFSKTGVNQDFLTPSTSIYQDINYKQSLELQIQQIDSNIDNCVNQIRDDVIESFKKYNIETTSKNLNEAFSRIDSGDYNVITRQNGLRNEVTNLHSQYLDNYNTKKILQNELELANFAQNSSIPVEYMGTKNKIIGNSKYGLDTVIEFDSYITKDGFEINIQKNIDLSKTGYSLNNVIESLTDIKSKSNIINYVDEINIMDIRNPDDVYWSQVHNIEFKSTATGGYGVINLFSPLTDEGIDNYVLAHEAAHNFDYDFSISNSKEWVDAVSLDGNFASKYAENAFNSRNIGQFAEDFADSVKNLFAFGDNTFRKVFPNRTRILEQLLPELFN